MHDQQKVVISFVIFNFSFRTLKTAVYVVGQIFLGLYCFNQLARFFVPDYDKGNPRWFENAYTLYQGKF